MCPFLFAGMSKNDLVHSHFFTRCAMSGAMRVRLSTWTYEALRQECARLGLVTYGTRQQRIDRIVAANRNIVAANRNIVRVRSVVEGVVVCANARPSKVRQRVTRSGIPIGVLVKKMRRVSRDK